MFVYVRAIHEKIKNHHPLIKPLHKSLINPKSQNKTVKPQHRITILCSVLLCHYTKVKPKQNKKLLICRSKMKYEEEDKKMFKPENSSTIKS